MNNKRIISIFVIIGTSIVYASSYKVIINPEHNKYDETEWINSGEITCDTITPSTKEVYYNRSFTQYFSECKEKQTSEKGFVKYIDSPSYTEEKIGELKLSNCSDILTQGYSIGDGIYPIKTSNGIELDVLCDMTTDGGGWTLVAYAGKITSNKVYTTGKAKYYHQPLIFNYGNIDINAQTTKSSFSRFDLFKENASTNDEILAKRTSSSLNRLIFPLSQLDFFGRSDSEGQFTITSANRNIPYLKMTNSGENGWKTVTNNTKWSYLGQTSSQYPGIDWNVSESLNCDNCGSYSTGLNHRSLLYWETSDSISDYHDTQWFHAQPLSLKASTGPSNKIQDIEFWYRKK